MNYLIIGGGTAAVGCVEGIRSLDREGTVTVLSAEPYPIYGRPLISYLLEGKTTQEKMLRYREPSWYEKNAVTLLHRRAVDVDAGARTVTLDGGAVLPYDRLCIATGSRPFVPPMEGLDTVENQTSFLTLDDARRLDTLLGPGKDKKVLIIGAGLIGLKCAEGILERCASLDIVDLAGRILPNVRPPPPPGITQGPLPAKGIRFHLSDSVVRFTPDTAALKSGKTLPFDVLVVAVGVRPNTELAARAGCTVERGIRVDCRSATGVEGIWAAGDCALSHDISADTDRILAILPNAYFQGETAGRNMAGGDAAFTQAIPMNASGFCGLHMITAGSYEGESYLSREDGSYKLLVTRDDRLVGFILLGEVDRAGIYTALIREETPLSSIDFDLIREKPQLMAFTRAERAKKLGGVKTW